VRCVITILVLTRIFNAWRVFRSQVPEEYRLFLNTAICMSICVLPSNCRLSHGSSSSYATSHYSFFGGRMIWQNHPSLLLVCGQIPQSLQMNTCWTCHVIIHFVNLLVSFLIPCTPLACVGPNIFLKIFHSEESIVSTVFRVSLSHRTVLQISVKSGTRTLQLAKRHLNSEKAEKYVLISEGKFHPRTSHEIREGE
jgi:hypothetical protein